MIAAEKFTARRVFLAPVLAAIFAAGISCGGGRDDVPLIFAAASLADALTKAAESYEAETGNEVEFSFGGSMALANQVARLDAPADGVILAGETPLELLTESGKVDAGDVFVTARNSLVVVSGDGSAPGSLDDPSFLGASVAIADPELAPAGQYAREALTSAGVWDEIEGAVIPTIDVRAALAAAGSGSVDFAIVYATDAATEPELSIALEIDPALHRPVVYPAAAVSGAEAFGAVNEFISFLGEAAGRKILEQHGFLVD